MDLIKKMFQTFTYVMAGSTICTAIFITIFNQDLSLTVDILWQIIMLSTACSLGNLIYGNNTVLSKKQMKIRIICHYLYINLMVLGGGLLWGWLSFSYLPEFFVMFIMIAVVYTIIMIVNFQVEAKIAENMNRHLRERYPEEED